MPKTVSFAKAVTPVVRRMEHTKDTKRYRVFGITEEMDDNARNNGLAEAEVRGVTGNLYLNLTETKDVSEVYVIITTEPPKDFEDPTVESEEE